MEILNGVFLVGGEDHRLSSGGNVYLVDAGKEMFLIDIGFTKDVKAILENIQMEGLNAREISTLFLTHCHGDHAEGAKKAKELLKCKIYAHNYTAEHLDEDIVDVKLTGEEKLIKDTAKITPIYTPSHSQGSMCYQVRMKGKELLFTGDVVFCLSSLDPKQMAGRPIEKWLENLKPSDATTYIKVLNNLMEKTHPDALLPGHGCLAPKEGSLELSRSAKAIIAELTHLFQE